MAKILDDTPTGGYATPLARNNRKALILLVNFTHIPLFGVVCMRELAVVIADLCVANGLGRCGKFPIWLSKSSYSTWWCWWSLHMKNTTFCRSDKIYEITVTLQRVPTKWYGMLLYSDSRWQGQTFTCRHMYNYNSGLCPYIIISTSCTASFTGHPSVLD